MDLRLFSEEERARAEDTPELLNRWPPSKILVKSVCNTLALGSLIQHSLVLCYCGLT